MSEDKERENCLLSGILSEILMDMYG